MIRKQLTQWVGNNDTITTDITNTCETVVKDSMWNQQGHYLGATALDNLIEDIKENQQGIAVQMQDGSTAFLSYSPKLVDMMKSTLNKFKTFPSTSFLDCSTSTVKHLYQLPTIMIDCYFVETALSQLQSLHSQTMLN